jgi:hypothetical protein
MSVTNQNKKIIEIKDLKKAEDNHVLNGFNMVLHEGKPSY